MAEQNPKFAERNADVLRCIIEEYLHSGNPVSSRTVSRRMECSISSATVRNVMSDLEDEGLLSQPHTSSGRVPTEKALRIYVDGMMDAEPLSDDEETSIADAFNEADGDALESVLLMSSHMLSNMSDNVSIVVMPRQLDLIYHKIEFIRLAPRRILSLFVAKVGLVTQKMITIDEDISQEDLDRAGAYLTETFAGMTAEEIEVQATKMFQQYRQLYYEYAQKAIVLANRIFPITAEDGVVVDGTSSLLERMEAGQISQLKDILQTFENKTKLVKILKQSIEHDGVTISIGGEAGEPGLHEMSFISAPYRVDGNPAGLLSVAGPTPIPYARISSLVKFMAREVNRQLGKSFDGLRPS